MGPYDPEKRTVLAATRWLAEHGYLGKRSSGGNVSLKVADQDAVAITPSARPYLKMTVEDVCVVDFDGNPLDGKLDPSIEAGMHIGVYRHYPDVKAVIHTHQTYASVLSLLNRPIPALFDEIIVEIGHGVEVIPYAFSGSAGLVQNVVGKLNNQCHCYLIQNHGALSLGSDMLNLARETGVRLQLSHLIFVGSRTWKTYEEALTLVDQATAEGLDVKFDTYAYHCGNSIINVFFPEWFLAKVPQAYDSKEDRSRLYLELQLIKALLGFGYEDIQIVNANHPELDQFNGMFLKDIAAKRDMSQFANFVDIAQKSQGRARVLNHRYSNAEIVKELMKHPASLYMTDATIFAKGAQNPAAYGNFPKFFEFARDYRLQTLEEAVYKMTGASAARFQIKDSIISTISYQLRAMS